jgi:transcriptional regulator with XRE-family HTH domain
MARTQIGEEIKHLRQKKNLTQTEVAELATGFGLYRQLIGRIEAGKVELTVRQLSGLAKVLDADVQGWLEMLTTAYVGR